MGKAFSLQEMEVALLDKANLVRASKADAPTFADTAHDSQRVIRIHAVWALARKAE
jgi:hypothetical protein